MASKKCDLSKNLVSMVLFFIVLIIIFALIYFNSQQIKKDQSDQNNQEFIGGQRDQHGCLGPAGYSWCESSQKCLRVWEEPCNDLIFATMEKMQNAISAKFTEVGPAKLAWQTESENGSEELEISGFRYLTTNGSSLQLQSMGDWLYENGFEINELNSSNDQNNVQTGYIKDNLRCLVMNVAKDYQKIGIECGILLPSMLPEISLEKQMQDLFARKYSKNSTDIKITITDSADLHLRGSVSFSLDGSAGGGIFLATKVEGTEWKIVFDGNGAYSCEAVAQYGFPNAMIFDCVQDNDSVAKPVVRNTSACIQDSDCIPLPSECHPLRCINKKFENQFEKPEMCTEMFAMNAAYNPEDCACLKGACENKNNL